MTSETKFNNEPLPQSPDDSIKWLEQRDKENAEYWHGRHDEVQALYWREKEQHQLTQEHLAKVIKKHDDLLKVLRQSQEHATALDNILLNEVPF